MDERGVLTVFAILINIDGKGMKKTIQTFPNVTRQQARGLFLDVKGMNPGMTIQGEYTVFF